MEGLPHDVIIGKPLMTNAHMIMVDPNFAHPPEHKKLCLLELPPKDKGKTVVIQLNDVRRANCASFRIKGQSDSISKAKSGGAESGLRGQDQGTGGCGSEKWEKRIFWEAPLNKVDSEQSPSDSPPALKSNNFGSTSRGYPPADSPSSSS